eukprot:CAMPEP_0197547582 /NCGR_PEP_ID=MMETSP1320-20131121/1911_1 /TAXON_ID=91990 /ORGANISM="Bolidomonas sp., Strain RCC2347" /LENGTH=159 /DNA_ID=CAMNT_0043107423 /DNA_START=568 /DNA_END=1043 /DNA_ORIENTATION=-
MRHIVQDVVPPPSSASPLSSSFPRAVPPHEDPAGVAVHVQRAFELPLLPRRVHGKDTPAQGLPLQPPQHIHADAVRALDDQEEDMPERHGLPLRDLGRALEREVPPRGAKVADDEGGGGDRQLRGDGRREEAGRREEQEVEGTRRGPRGHRSVCYGALR